MSNRASGPKWRWSRSLSSYTAESTSALLTPLLLAPMFGNRCQRSMFVARDEHEKANIIVCPLPDCNHAWCKQCQQSIDFDRSEHSCDDTSELDHLMDQMGRKYCPRKPARACCHLRSEIVCKISLFFSVQDTDPENIWM